MMTGGTPHLWKPPCESRIFILSDGNIGTSYLESIRDGTRYRTIVGVEINKLTDRTMIYHFTYVYVNTYMSMYIHIYIYTYIHIYIYTYIHVDNTVPPRSKLVRIPYYVIYTCMCANINIYIYTYIYMYMYITSKNPRKS